VPERLSLPQLPQHPHELTEDRERPFTAEAARSGTPDLEP